MSKLYINMQNNLEFNISRREDPRDVVIMKNGVVSTIQNLAPQSTIGTSSVRRRAQLVSKFPNLKFVDIRGNLNTRLKKLDEGNTYDAIILAAAGVKRMGWENRISQVTINNHFNARQSNPFFVGSYSFWTPRTAFMLLAKVQLLLNAARTMKKFWVWSGSWPTNRLF